MEKNIQKNEENLRSFFDLMMKVATSHKASNFCEGASTESGIDISNPVDRRILYEITYKLHHVNVVANSLQSYKEKYVFLINIKTDALQKLKSQDYEPLRTKFLEEIQLELDKYKELMPLYSEEDVEKNEKVDKILYKRPITSTNRKSQDDEMSLRQKVYVLMLLTFGRLDKPPGIIQERFVEFFQSIIGGDISDIRKFIKSSTKLNEKNQSTRSICNDLNIILNQFKQLGFTQNVERIRNELELIIEGQNSKDYRLPYESEKAILNDIPLIERPSEKMQRNSAGGDTFSWGITDWGQMFSSRQLLTMQTLVQKLNEIKHEIEIKNDYGQGVITYLGILVNRISMNLTSFGLWKPSGEFLSSPFGRQAIQMICDFPESQPFSESGGAGLNQLDWIKRYIETECNFPFHTILQNASSGDKEQFNEKSVTAVVTDPPYYDAIAYADISDFFYVWLKRTCGDIYPVNFTTPQTPKTEECTALKHHHGGSIEKAKQHFENKLLQIFDAIEHQTSDVVSIMFAHQSTEAWTTLCNSILGARLNITGSWAIDSERSVRGVALSGAALESSVTVSCKPANRSGFGDYKQVKTAIEKKVEEEVAELYALGFRGADLLTACFGKAVSEFGKYERVEKASGDEVTVAELLEMTRESAFNALLKGFKGDDFTKFYIGWLELYGFTENDFDDAAKFSRVGLSINVQDLFSNEIFVKNGNKQSLAKYDERVAKKKNLGENADASLIDQVHKAMWLYKNGTRPSLLSFIGKTAAQSDSVFWRVLTSLDELLPKGMDDQKQVSGLLENKDNLIRESQNTQPTAEQQGLFS